MKKILAVFCCAIMLTGPMMAATRSDGYLPGGGPSNHDYCYEHPDECQGGTKKHAKKNSNTTKIVVASVAAGAVFAGAMWYIFKKKPSENNPGQVKLAAF